jgi:hypothetical protein
VVVGSVSLQDVPSVVVKYGCWLAMSSIPFDVTT